MQICLVRHAIAVERGSSGYLDDRARPLTREGRRRMAEVARGLRTLVRPDEILTSPVLRARQTAAILAKAWDRDVVELDALGAGNHDATISALNQSNVASVALVGHEPWLSELLSLLLTGDAESAAFEFKKGAAALLEGEGAAAPGSFRLVWFVPPSALRALGR